MDLSVYHKRTSLLPQRRDGRRWRRVRRFAALTVKAAYAPSIAAVPFLLMVLIACIDFATLEYSADSVESLFSQRFQTISEDSDAIARAEVIQKAWQTLAYGLLVVLILARLGPIVQFFWKEKTLLLLTVTLLTSVLVSDYPSKVVTNVIHAVFALAAVYFFLYGSRPGGAIATRLQWAVALTTSTVHVASLAVWFSIDTGGLALIAEGWRYGGFAGNPNSMGSMCVLTCWASWSLLANRKLSWKLRMLAAASSFLALFSAHLAASVTTFVVLALIAAATLTRYFIDAFTAPVQRILTAMMMILALGATPIYLLNAEPRQGSILEEASENLTGDSTLTGRTDIWSIGTAAIRERPLLGWSYDTHQTIFDDRRFELPYHQYHNGYIDVAVSGGLLLFSILAMQVIITLLRCLKHHKSGGDAFSLMLFATALLLHNLSEWSLVRPINSLWLVYLACAVTAAMLMSSHPTIQRKAPVARPGTPRRSRRRALRF